MSKAILWVLDVLSVGGAMIGSLLLAMNSEWSKWGYLFFMVGTLAGILVLLRSNVRRSQVFISVWFLGMNSLGIIRWFNLY